MQEEINNALDTKAPKKKKAIMEPDRVTEDDSELWLVSYADMMSLIACFFMLMMAFANYDPVGFKRKTKEVAESFSGEQFQEANGKLEELKDDIQGHPDLKQMTNVAIADDGLVITFGSEQLFDPGSAQIKPEVLETLEIMIDLILQKNPNFRVLVEGHTDNLGVGKSTRFKSNWELSSARAASVIEQFELFGFQKTHLVAVGYADTRPVAQNQDENGVNNYENMALNRRAVIKVLEPMDDKSNKRLGLGAFFNDGEVFPEEDKPKMERLQEETR